MPIEFGLWRVDGDERRLSSTKLDQESRLEDLIEKDPNVLGQDLLIVGRQVRTASGNFIDLLGIDADGDLHVIELKRDRTPRNVVTQALDYASWVRDQTYDDIKELYEQYADDQAFEAAFGDRFNFARPEEESGVPEDVNQSHTVTIVSSELDVATERIIQYLSEEYSVPINAIRFNYYEDGDREYIGRTWLIDPQEIAEQPGKKESWNGQYYYVSFGHGKYRSWDDARKYGFISAGQGEWYSRTLSQLSPGDHVFVHIPKQGYVGVGEVTQEKTPVSEFDVEIDGQQRNILDVDIDADHMDENAEDPDQREYLVGVDWIDTRPVAHAYWETGMYANQNTVTKLRNQFTLDQLNNEFNTDP